MIAKWSEKLSESLVQNGIIQSNDREVYQFGIQQGLMSMINIITTIILGLLFHALWQSMVFMLAYIPLRHFAGGYHAKTPRRCYLYSIVLISILLLAITHLIISDFVGVLMYFTSSIIILVFSPVEATTKPLDSNERKIYKQRACGIWLIESFIVMIAYIIQIRPLYICLTWVLSFLAFMLCIAKVYENIMLLKRKDSDNPNRLS